MSKDNALRIGLVPVAYRYSPVVVPNKLTPDTAAANATYEERVQMAAQYNGTEEDVRHVMDVAQKHIYPDETTLGRPMTFADLSPFRQINVLDLVTDAVVQVRVAERENYEQLGIDVEKLANEFHRANAGLPTRRSMPEILADVLALPAEYMNQVLTHNPRKTRGK